MDPLLVYPDPPSAEVVRTLDLSGFSWKAVSNAAEAMQAETTGEWSGALIACNDNPEIALSICRALRKVNGNLHVLLLLSGAQLSEMELQPDLFDDFCVTPFHPQELEARLRHLFVRNGASTSPDLIAYGELALNLETYQAAIGDKPLDLTYMEYELLRFFATHPNKVFTREQLLSTVWGYEYYGGARTVDVHVRRLRAKLGEQYASLIQTVRSVGYKFGQERWLPEATAS